MPGLKTLRGRLLALGIIALAGLMAAGGFGLLQLYRLDRGVAEDLGRLQRTVEIGLDVQNASIDFKTQVQEWTSSSSSATARVSKSTHRRCHPVWVTSPVACRPKDRRASRK